MMNQEHEEFFREIFCSRTHRMKDMLNPSLQHMTMVKIAIELWNQNDVRESLPKFRFVKKYPPNFKQWREMNMKVLDKVTQLPIPECLKRKFSSVTSSIGVELMNWRRFHRWELNISKWPDQLVWTSRGTIDRKRTAEMLIKDEKWDLITRYKFACVYCLEKEIPELWKQIPEEQKQYFLSMQTSRNLNVPKLVIFWTHHLFGEASDLEEIIEKNGFRNYPPHMYAYRSGVKRGNVVATKFFFDKLSEEEIDAVLLVDSMGALQARFQSSKSEDYYSEVFFFLMSKMSSTQQVQLLVHYPYAVLSCFLDKPFQPFFMPLAELIMANGPILDLSYVILLLSISYKIASGGIDFDYRKLFCDFWNASPLAHKRLTVENHQLLSFIVINWLEVGEKSIIEMLLEHANTIEKERLILGGEVIPRLVRREKWDSVRVFLEMCDMTKEAMMNLNDTLMKRHSRNVDRRGDESERDYYESDLPKWNIFFHLLDELIAKKSEDKKML